MWLLFVFIIYLFVKDDNADEKRIVSWSKTQKVP